MPENFGAFLTFIGSSAAIGAVISWLAQNWAWFQKRASGEKVLILIIASALMGFASHFLVKYIPAGVVADAEPYYQIIVQSIVIVLASQVYHQLVGVPAETKALEQPKGTVG